MIIRISCISVNEVEQSPFSNTAILRGRTAPAIGWNILDSMLHIPPGLELLDHQN